MHLVFVMLWVFGRIKGISGLLSAKFETYCFGDITRVMLGLGTPLGLEYPTWSLVMPRLVHLLRIPAVGLSCI